MKPDSLQEVETSGSNMTISDSNKDTIVRQRFELSEMVPLSEVVRFSWNADKARRLKVLRGKMSRPTIVEELAKLGCNYSSQYLADLEYGKGDSIAADLLLAICKVFNVPLSYFLPTARVETETTNFSE